MKGILRIIESNSARDAFYQLAKGLYENSDFVSSPRGMETKEILNCVVVITDPYNRLWCTFYRKMSLKYLIGEWLWYERGSNSLSEISYYSRFWNKISDDGLTCNSAYGYRIFTKNDASDFNQWENVKSQLMRDKETRRAVIELCVPTDLRGETRDLPCTMYLQFIIRNNKLNLTVSMRSNDLIRGFTYDVPAFTLF